MTEQDTTPHKAKDYDYIPLAGHAGRKTTFTFKYRSNGTEHAGRTPCGHLLNFTSGTLRSLGCIPRTPSPEPDYAAELQRTKQLLEQEKSARRTAEAECVAAKQQLQEIKQFINSGVSKPSTSTVPLKREREVKDEADLETPARAPARRRTAVTIELDD